MFNLPGFTTFVPGGLPGTLACWRLPEHGVATMKSTSCIECAAPGTDS